MPLPNLEIESLQQPSCMPVTRPTIHSSLKSTLCKPTLLHIRAFMVAHPSNGVYIEEAPAARISSRRHADNAAANREENQCSFHSADLHIWS